MDSVPSNPPKTKQCSKCGCDLPLSEYNKDATHFDGLQSACKACKCEYNRQYYATHYEKVREQQREYNRQYHAAHRDERSQQGKQYRAAHRDKVRERQRQYDATHREQASERMRQWRTNNPEKVKAADHRRRARQIGADGSHTAADLDLQLRGQGGNCWWCGKPMGKDCTVDHVIPLDKGGSNWPENIVLAHGRCNSKKGTRSPGEAFGRLL